tara:strand:+ start:7219 stop:10443 length:3225 start_codon:yes stop_codon:yes gene_type:complete
MHFTIKQKISIVFAVLVLGSLFTTLSLYIAFIIVDKSVHSIADSAEPAREASFEMEINTIGLGLGVFKYLETLSPEHRQRVIKDDKDFRRFKRQYEQNIVTDRGLKLSTRVSTLYEEYKSLADTLLDDSDDQTALLANTHASINTVRFLIQNDLEPLFSDTEPKSLVHEKTRQLISISKSITNSVYELSIYLTPRLNDKTLVRESINQNKKLIQRSIAKLKQLKPSPQELLYIQAVEEHFQYIYPTIQTILASYDKRISNISRFIQLRQVIDDILDDELQHLATVDLAQAKEYAKDASNIALVIICILLPLMTVLTIIGGIHLYRVIAKPIHYLIRGTKKVSTGDLSYRLSLEGNNEFTTLADRFNHMVERLQVTMVSKIELEKSEEKFRILTEHSPIGMFLGNSKGEAILFNQKCVELIGNSRDQILGVNWVSALHPDDRKWVVPLWLDAINTGEDFHEEYRWIHSNGDIIWTQGDVLAVKDPQGEILLFIGTLIDITLRKSTEASLRESEERFRLLVEIAPESIFIHQDRKFIFVNMVTATTFKMSNHHELIGQSIFDFVHPDYKKIIENFNLAIEQYQNNNPVIEVQLLHKDGTAFFAEMSGVHFVYEGKPAIQIIMRDITDRKHKEALLQHLVNFDQLTNLPNRMMYSDRLQQAINDAKRRNRMVGIMFLDLDRFKNVNDSMGHALGDELLQSVAHILRGTLRASDTVARLSGDEFAFVIADMMHEDEASLVASKIIAALDDPIKVGYTSIRITASIGISIYPLDDLEVVNLLRDADAAMYVAKNSGRNNYVYYKPSMTISANEALALEQDLRIAIINNELSLHYQPIFDSQSGCIISVEALARWQHADRGMIPPDKFIPTAEETGLIIKLGDWVIQTVCAQLKTWHESGYAINNVSINVSYAQFNDQLLPTILQALEINSLTPSELTIEVTESLLMKDVDKTTKILNLIHEHGIQISMDDFGTGYSSLNMLWKFPIDILKIDRGFAQEIESSADNVAIVLAIIAMAKSLNLTTIIEGIETISQKAILLAMGCDQFQGFYFSRPLDTKTLEDNFFIDKDCFTTFQVSHDT